MITIFLADDHTVVRQGLRKVLESEAELSVVGEAGSGLDVVDAVDALKPDILLLDLGLPGLHGLEVIRRVAHRTPATRVLVLSMHANDEYVIGAFRNGASGYLLKGADAAELVIAIRRLASGTYYVSPAVSEQVVNALLENPPAVTDDPYEALSAREREVFQLMAEGYSNAGIASRLFISGRTVETHRANVLRKLGLRSQTAIVRYAVRRGLLPPD